MKKKIFTAMAALGISAVCMFGTTAGAEDSFNPSWRETPTRSGALLETPVTKRTRFQRPFYGLLH